MTKGHIINHTLVNKLTGIITDFEVCINHTYTNLEKDIPIMDAEDITEMIEIRSKLKTLTKKLKSKLKNYSVVPIISEGELIIIGDGFNPELPALIFPIFNTLRLHLVGKMCYERYRFVKDYQNQVSTQGMGLSGVVKSIKIHRFTKQFIVEFDIESDIRHCPAEYVTNDINLRDLIVPLEH